MPFVARAVECSDPSFKKTASISVAFAYTHSGFGGRFQLPNAVNDGVFYSGGSFVHHFTTNKTLISDSNGRISKQAFLAKIAAAAGDSEYVNFNYSGHGVRLEDGRWALVLPTIPLDLMAKCFPHFSGTGKSMAVFNIHPTCDKFKNYVVTADEIRTALSGKKIFAVIDACYAGAADFGPDSGTFVSSLASQLSEDGTTNHGAFTQHLAQMLRDCRYDRNGNGEVSVDEVARFFASVSPTTQSIHELGDNITGITPNNLNIATGYGRQNPGYIGRGGDTSWLQCVNLSEVNPQHCNVTTPPPAGSEAQ